MEAILLFGAFLILIGLFFDVVLPVIAQYLGAVIFILIIIVIAGFIVKMLKKQKQEDENRKKEEIRRIENENLFKPENIARLYFGYDAISNYSCNRGNVNITLNLDSHSERRKSPKDFIPQFVFNNIYDCFKNSIPKIDKMNVIIFLPKEDKYGNTSWNKIVEFQISKNSIEKINIENFIRENLWEITDSLKIEDEKVWNSPYNRNWTK